ncbi:MAG: DUF3179 domain-containing (seleno)protein [Acidimicrobiales bacterium]|nr:DUF3179 domain-containing (seleno)protein [Acidimicrobiales bacterium]
MDLTPGSPTLPAKARRFRVGALLVTVVVIATACTSTDSSESVSVSGTDNPTTTATSTSEPVATSPASDSPTTAIPTTQNIPDVTTTQVDEEPAAAPVYPIEPFEVEQIAADLPDFGPSAIANRFDDAFPKPLVDPNRIRSGGPPPDGIPPLDTPRFVTAQIVDFLRLNEPVLALSVGGESRAYPIQIMTWHEIVNDTVGGIPVSVTYCPLCNSAVAYDRRLGDRVLSFGTSGMLYNSALVMYDRQTESLWSHFTGEAIVGLLAGKQATTYPVSTVAWGDWLSTNPDSLVLSNDTGWSRDYGRNPYPGYDDVDTIPFLFDGDTDGRLLAKERVIGIRRGDDSAAITLENLTDEGVLNIDLAGQRISVWHRPGTASALTTSPWPTAGTSARREPSCRCSMVKSSGSPPMASGSSTTGLTAGGMCSARQLPGLSPVPGWKPSNTSTPSGSHGRHSDPTRGSSPDQPPGTNQPWLGSSPAARLSPNSLSRSRACSESPLPERPAEALIDS